MRSVWSGRNAGERSLILVKSMPDAGRVELRRLDDDLDLEGVAVDLFALAVYSRRKWAAENLIADFRIQLIVDPPCPSYCERIGSVPTSRRRGPGAGRRSTPPQGFSFPP